MCSHSMIRKHLLQEARPMPTGHSGESNSPGIQLQLLTHLPAYRLMVCNLVYDSYLS